MKDKAPQAQPLPRPPERSRRIRRPHVSASRTPTANALASARVSRSESLAERGTEVWTSEARSHNEGTPADQRESRGAALAVGVRPQRGDPDTLTRRVGVWPNSLFSGGTSLRSARGKSVCWTRPPRGGANLLAQSERLDARRIEEKPRVGYTGVCTGVCLGSLCSE